MKKPKIKVRELKPKMKIVSELPSKSDLSTTDSLEEVIDIESNSPTVQNVNVNNINPTLTQRFEAQERKFESSVRREEAEKEHFTYQMLNKESRRKYNSSIENQSSITADQAASSQRVDPSLPSAGPIRGLPAGQASGDLRDALNQGGVEPGLRKFNQGEDREYEAEKSVQKYLARRRTEMM